MLTSMGSLLHEHYPWTEKPLICSAPMRLISGSSIALAVSRAGGLGFIGAGAGSDLSTLPSTLQETVSLVSSSPIPKNTRGYLTRWSRLPELGCRPRACRSRIQKSSPEACCSLVLRPQKHRGSYEVDGADSSCHAEQNKDLDTSWFRCCGT